MSYVIQAVLSSTQHPEHGQITIPFPIPLEQYDQTIGMLQAADLGFSVNRNCKVDEIDSASETGLRRTVRPADGAPDGDPKKVTGVFDLAFDKQEVSVADAADGWKTYSMQDASSAIYHAYRKSYLTAEQYEKRFAERLANRQVTSAGHLSARDIQLAEEICEMDGQRLNFYLDASFDMDAVFGTHACTGENDDTLNVYADYDMAAGQVCDELEIDLHRADGREESLEYQLNAVEKQTLLHKMDEYCQQQTGQTLEEYSAQRLAEDMTPPTCPAM